MFEGDGLSIESTCFQISASADCSIVEYESEMCGQGSTGHIFLSFLWYPDKHP